MMIDSNKYNDNDNSARYYYCSPSNCARFPPYSLVTVS